ncbi:MAG: UUP1 family membrane protein [Deltaproteobacteria bacterium]|nr:UUP1 family membrane protein [Deltaproteobacteria bacterium]MBW2543044.1 UUP1 family membrane protein [Deltaproteobacteria bacterium]
MSRPVLFTGIALLLFAIGVVGWKALILDLPLAPSGAKGLWRVELEVSARGTGRRGSVRVPLPSLGPGQAVFDERIQSDRLLFAIRNEDGQRFAIWSGRFEGVHELAHGFRVQLDPSRAPVTGGNAAAPSGIVERYGPRASEIPADDTTIPQLFERISLPPASDPEGRLRSLFSFVADEVATRDTASDDAILTLAAREGSQVGKTRSLVMLLRGAGIPARVVLGLKLQTGTPPEEVVWAQAWLGGVWVPLSPVEGFFGERPADRVALRFGSDQAIETSGVEAVGRRYHALREQLRPEELTALMVPNSDLLAALSLYRLPLPTQSALRGLLLLPIGALIVALFRNIIGVPTFGTFMPILIAFALRSYPLAPGLLLVGSVLCVGIFGRLAFERLHLLLVPRLSLLLCIVVLLVTGAAIVGRGSNIHNLLAGVLFPLVILTMLIERFAVTLSEEGWRSALERAGWSIAVAIVVHPVFRSASAQQLMFGYPELVVGISGLLILIGGYTGFRVSDLIRFRAFARFGARASR